MPRDAPRSAEMARDCISRRCMLPSLPAAGRWRHVTPGKGCVSTGRRRFQTLSFSLSLSLSSYPSLSLSLSLSPVGRDSHPEEVVVVGRALHEVVRAGHDDEPLRIVVDHEVDDMLEAEGDGEHPHKAVRRDDGRGAGDRLHERPQVLRHLVKHAQRVLVAVLGDHAPQLLDRAPELCRHTRAFRVELVHVDDQLGFGRVDVEQVVEVRRPPRAERPRRRRVRDAVVAESHPDCADDDRLGRRLEAGRAGARSRL
mmetsp:Transcript_50154/g.163870  ORF Transcript_50154/g.163870 Transcript_50154/m.163870 type:complete len:255 (-) Transcript_50154:419-1183(-)